MNNETYYFGSDLKFQFTITANGFDQYMDDWSVTLYSGNKSVTWEKHGEGDSDCDKHIFMSETEEEPSEHNWYLLVPTELLGNGPLKVVVTANVPDSDFSEINPVKDSEGEIIEGEGYRREIAIQGLGTIKKVI